jgi:hypothetical protein
MRWLRAWMDARRLRRRMAIVDALDDNRSGLSALELANAVQRPVGTLYADLAWLERHAWIESWWVPGPYPRRRLYGRCKP